MTGKVLLQTRKYLGSDSWSFIKKETTLRRAVFKRDVPKSWTLIGPIGRPCGDYESGCVSIYKTRNGYGFSGYYDGSFYPLVGLTNLSSEDIKEFFK